VSFRSLTAELKGRVLTEADAWLARDRWAPDEALGVRGVGG
jgi:hypothetical protein